MRLKAGGVRVLRWVRRVVVPALEGLLQFSNAEGGWGDMYREDILAFFAFGVSGG